MKLYGAVGCASSVFALSDDYKSATPTMIPTVNGTEPVRMTTRTPNAQSAKASARQRYASSGVGSRTSGDNVARIMAAIYELREN